MRERLDKYKAGLTTEQIHDMAVSAGRKSVQARKAKKEREHTISAAMRELLTGGALLPETRDALAARGISDPDGAMAVAAAVFDRAVLTGDPMAARYVAEYTEGKPTDKVEVGGMDGKPIEAIDLTKMTDEQLQMLIAARKKQG